MFLILLICANVCKNSPLEFNYVMEVYTWIIFEMEPCERLQLSGVNVFEVV